MTALWQSPRLEAEKVAILIYFMSGGPQAIYKTNGLGRAGFNLEFWHIKPNFIAIPQASIWEIRICFLVLTFLFCLTFLEKCGFLLNMFIKLTCVSVFLVRIKVFKSVSIRFDVSNQMNWLNLWICCLGHYCDLDLRLELT